MKGALLDEFEAAWPRRRLSRGGVAALALVAAALALTCSPPTRPSTGGSFVFVGAGDIANHDILAEGAEMTARLIEAMPDAVVFTAGDNAYPSGTEADFLQNYEPTWGRFKNRTYPTIGNHDTTGVSNAGVAYFNYFGSKAGPKGLGYYSITLGNWKIFSLNSETDASIGSLQWNWLRGELQGTASSRTAGGPSPRCSLAIWHKPLFSSGGHGNDEGRMRDIWQMFSDVGGDVVISAHDHLYERFALQTADGRSDPARGIRQFVVGTGGGDARSGFVTVTPNSEVRIGPNVYGVLKMTLFDGGYTWEFISTTAGALDSGSGTCH